MEDKFEYFYRPYNYICNVEKFINYDGEAIKGDKDPFRLYEELLSEEPYIDEFLRSKGMARSQSEPQRLMQMNSLLFQMERINAERSGVPDH